MEFADFRNSLSASTPPALSPYLIALWYDAKGNWDTAHGLVDDLEGSTAAWVHAYLHRKEGDAGNAAYWYRRAGKPVATMSLEEEWQSMVMALLKEV